MKEWKVIIETEKTINCLPDVLYVRNNDGKKIKLPLTVFTGSCEYCNDGRDGEPEIYIEVCPYDIHNVYIVCTVNDTSVFEELVSYEEVSKTLNETLTKLIIKHLYEI